MKVCRFNNGRIGVVRGGYIHDVSAILQHLPAVALPVAGADPLIENLDALREQMEKLADEAPSLDVQSVSLLSPVASPSRIIGITSNYYPLATGAAMKVKPAKEPELFIKPGCALVGPAQGITLRFADRQTDQEAELGVVIGKRGSDIAEADALNYIAGYAAALDLAVGGAEDRSIRKSVDSYAVLGPWLVTKDEVPDPQNLNFQLSINGDVKQRANTGLMRVSIARQIAWMSTFFTLNPGDVLLTGTCDGAGPISAGDTLTMTLDRIGDMTVLARRHLAVG